MDTQLTEKLKETLESEKSSLEKELQGFARKDESLKDDPNREKSNMEEEADEMQEYDNLLSLEHNLELRLKDVKWALEKMEKGSYGTCEKCGKQIETERLMASPEARLCMHCNNHN